MLIFEDVVTGDELISDAFDIKEVDDIAFEVDSKTVTIKEGDVDIGANASAENPGEDEAEDGAQTVDVIQHSFRLNETSFDKKAYLGHLKSYMKTLKADLQKKADGGDEKAKGRLEGFEGKAQGFAKKIIANFKDYEFYTGESFNPDAMVVLKNYRVSDGVTPYFIFWKDGLKEVKV